MSIYKYVHDNHSHNSNVASLPVDSQRAGRVNAEAPETAAWLDRRGLKGLAFAASASIGAFGLCPELASLPTPQHKTGPCLIWLLVDRMFSGLSGSSDCDLRLLGSAWALGRSVSVHE